MTQLGFDPSLSVTGEASDPALMAMARQGDPMGIEGLVARHALAMTRFEALVGMAVTSDPQHRVTRLLEDQTLPLRATWLADRASNFAHDADDAFLLARFTDLTVAWRTALWHAEVEGDSPVAIGLLLGIEAHQASLTVRTARNRMLWSIVELTPAGSSQDCLDLAARLCGAGADAKEVLAAAASHGRSCDDCMLLVKRSVLFASSLRDSLLRSVAGELATAYSAARPPAFRPRARGDLAGVLAQHGRPAAMTLAMAGAAAAAVAALVVGPGAVSPYFSTEEQVMAAVVPGQLFEPVARTAAPSAPSASLVSDVRTTRLPADASSLTPQEPSEGRSDGGSASSPGGGSTTSPDETGAPGAPGTPSTPADPDTPGTPGTPSTPSTPGTPGTPGTPEPDKDDGGGTSQPVVPGGSTTAGPITVDTTGDAPLVTVDGPVPVEIPALPDLGNQVTETAGGIVSGLLG
jgi:hypothetical protein